MIYAKGQLEMEESAAVNHRLKKVLAGSFPFLLIASVMLARNPEAVFRAEFWAEDASELFARAMTDGAAALFTPVWGYFFFLQRLVAWAASYLPVLWAPYIYAGFALVTNVLSVAYFSRDGFSWLIPSKAFRVLACIAMALGPGSAEVFLNLINTATPLGLLALLLLLEKPHPISRGRFFLYLLLVTSVGHLFLFLPLVALLWYRTRSRFYLIIGAVQVPMSVLNSIGNHITGTRENLLNYGAALQGPRLFLENAISRCFITPFLGPDLADPVVRSPAVLFWGMGFILLFGVGCLLWKNRRAYQDEIVFLITSLICVLATYAVIAIVRTVNIPIISRHSVLDGQALWSMRYSFLTGSFSILCWFVLILRSYSETRAISIRNLMTRWLPVTIILLQVLYYSDRIYRRKDLGWPAHAEQIQAHLKQMESDGLKSNTFRDTVIKAQIHPVTWYRNTMRVRFSRTGIDFEFSPN